jgi:hypothetical protein
VLRKVSIGNRTLVRPLPPNLSTTCSRPPSPGPASWRPLHRALAARGVRQLRHLRASDRAIAHQTRHRSLASVVTYVRIHQAWEDNAATMLGLYAVVTRPVERRREGHG